MKSIEIVLPEQHMDELADRLVALTEAIDAVDPERVAHGFLGGSHGYGGHWDSAAFQMRPFCWCESESCPWCAGCDCPAGSVHYLVDGVEVGFDAWMAFFERETAPQLDYARNYTETAHDAWMRRAEAANARRSTVEDKVCPYCRGERFTEFGAAAGKGAPNFWHKPSGLKVWWYKYIGRSQEAVAPADCDIAAVFAECLQDVAAAQSSGEPTPQDASAKPTSAPLATDEPSRSALSKLEGEGK